MGQINGANLLAFCSLAQQAADSAITTRGNMDALAKHYVELRDKASYYEQLVKMLVANADNDKLGDADFRRVVRNSTPEFKVANADVTGDALARRPG